MPEEHVAGAEDRERRRADEVVPPDAGQSGFGVGDHLVHAVLAEGGSDDRDPRPLRRRAPKPLAVVQTELGKPKPSLGLFGSPAEGMDPASLQGNCRIALEQGRIFEFFQPTFDRHDPAAVVHRQRDCRDDARDAAHVASQTPVLECRLQIPVRLVPIRRATMQNRHELRLSIS